jgi:hypothetical protein
VTSRFSCRIRSRAWQLSNYSQCNFNILQTVMCRITTFRSTTDRTHDGPKNLLDTLYKLIVKENYLPEQIFNINETSLFWKRMSERTFVHKEAKSMSGFTTTKSPISQNVSPVVKRRMTVLKMYSLTSKRGENTHTIRKHAYHKKTCIL